MKKHYGTHIIVILAMLLGGLAPAGVQAAPSEHEIIEYVQTCVKTGKYVNAVSGYVLELIENDVRFKEVLQGKPLKRERRTYAPDEKFIDMGVNDTMDNAPLSYNDYVKGIQTLTLEEQLDLLELIFTNVRVTMLRTAQPRMSKLAKLTPARLIVGDPEELAELKVWEWNEPQNLS